MIRNILNSLPKQRNTFLRLSQSYSTINYWPTCRNCLGSGHQKHNYLHVFTRRWFASSCVRSQQRGNHGDNGQQDGSSGSVQELDTGQTHSALARIGVPENFPVVPIISLKQTPLFPNVLPSRIIEVTDKRLADILRMQWDLARPYAGAFLWKGETNNGEEGEVVYELNEIHAVGTFVRISEMHDIAGDKLRIAIEGHRRIQIISAASDQFQTTPAYTCLQTDDNDNNINNKDNTADEIGVNKSEDMSMDGVTMRKPILFANVENLIEEPYKRTQELKAVRGEIFKTVQDMCLQNPMFKASMSKMIEVGKPDFDNPAHLGDFFAAITKCEPLQLQAVLEELNIPNRLMRTLELLKKDHAVVSLQQRLHKEVEDKINKMQRKYMLQEQLKIIKGELGLQKDDKESVIEKFRSRLISLVVPEKINKVIEEEMNKFSYLDHNSQEFSVTRNYLDWLTSVPWGLHSKEVFNIERAKEILDQDHYGLDDIKERILEFIAVGQLSGNVQGKILCFTGPPGVGKTSIGKSIARALNREYFRFSVGGLTDVAEIKGHRRTYVGAMPGQVVQCLKKTKTENPLILIDEVDKIGHGGHQGDPASALLELLDPEQNSYFLDHYLDVPLDLSKVLFICTANVIETIPGPLRDRMEIIHVSGYVDEEKVGIAENYLIPVAMEACGVTKELANLTPEALQVLIQLYCRESGVRNLQKHIEKLFRKSALKYVKEKNEIVITPENLHKFVGNPRFNSEMMYAGTLPPGISIGLAWTSLGGSTLFIETVLNEQTDKQAAMLEMTGQLGDVMKESIQIAYTFAKAYFLKHNPKNKFFTTSSIHLHIPEGATPKDGPSAGCTIITALLSLAKEQPIKSKLAMTGEVSLTGKVLPVGGIKEKLLAARRSNIKTVLLPEGNRKDYNDLPEFLKIDFNVVFISDYDDVFREVFDVQKVSS